MGRHAHAVRYGEEREGGVVVRVVCDRGFGFIRANKDGVDYFFHRSACEPLFPTLLAGTPVTFIVGESRKGPRAEAIEKA